MYKRYRAFLLLTAVFSAVSVFGHPAFLDDYKKDPLYRASSDECGACHVAPGGGGDRNAFGKAFEAGGQKFTPMLRAQFPDRFTVPVQKMSDTVTIYFADPNGKQIVVDVAGKKSVVDAESASVDGQPAPKQ